MPGFMGASSSLKIELDVPVMMRDGTTLYADVYRPDTSEKVPVLLQRTPYNKAIAQASRTGTLDAVRAASHGYVVVVQDTRGRYTSEGDFYHLLVTRSTTATTPWSACAAQPWSSGQGGYVRPLLRRAPPSGWPPCRAPPSLACHRARDHGFGLPRGLDLPGRRHGLGVRCLLDPVQTWTLANLGNAISRSYRIVPEDTASRSSSRPVGPEWTMNFLSTPTQGVSPLEGGPGAPTSTTG